MEDKVKITYRGWPGHFICGDRCVFHLNSLLECGDLKIVVSTVGMLKTENGNYDTIGCDRYYETMAFVAKRENEFYDANVNKQLEIESRCCWGKLKDEWKANKGHWKVIEEIKNKMLNGSIKIIGEDHE